MNTSENIADLATALALAQAEMKNATLNKVNPHYKNKYADLAAVRAATLPALNKHGLSILQTTQITDAGLVLVTRLAHKSGQWMDSTYPLPLAADKPQIMGSALTYARRYAWSSLCAVFADDDDDAEGASKADAGKAWGDPSVTPAQVKVLQTAIVEVGADLPRFLKVLGIDRLDDLPAGQYQAAMDKLMAKRAKTGATNGA
jgi:hypothetical protein